MSKDNLTPQEQLNEVLKFLLPLNVISYANWKSDLKTKLNLDFDDNDFRSIFYKLKKDGYIDGTTSQPSSYFITFDGKLFIGDGGYVQEKQNRIREIERQENYNTRMEGMATRTDASTSRLARYTRWLAFATYALVVATLFLFLVELGAKWDELMHVVCGRP